MSSEELEVPSVETVQEEENKNFIGFKVYCSQSPGELDIVIAKPPNMDIFELEYIIRQLQRSLENNIRIKMYDALSAKIPTTPVEQAPQEEHS